MSTSKTKVSYDASRYDEAGFSTASSTNPEGVSQRYTEMSGTNDREGTTTQRRFEETGKPVLESTNQVRPGQHDDGHVEKAMANKIDEISNFRDRPGLEHRFLSDDIEFGKNRPDPFAKRDDPFGDRGHNSSARHDPYANQGRRDLAEPIQRYEPEITGQDGSHHDRPHHHQHHQQQHERRDRQDPYNGDGFQGQGRNEPFGSGQGQHDYDRQDPFVKRDEHYGGREDPFAGQQRGFGGEESRTAEEGRSAGTHHGHGHGHGPSVKRDMHREYDDAQQTGRQHESDQAFEQLMEDEYAKREGGA